jgi:hypothetical protein
MNVEDIIASDEGNFNAVTGIVMSVLGLMPVGMGFQDRSRS